MPAVALYLLLGSVALAAIYAIFVVVPRECRRMYRLQLWKLRDDLIDDLIGGKIQSSKSAVSMLNVLEHAIVSADDFTAGRVLMTFFAARDQPKDEEFLPDGVPDVDRLREYRQRLTDTRVRWVLLTSPFGWTSALWIPVAWIVYRLFTGRRVLGPLPDRTAVVSKRVDLSGRPASQLDPIDPKYLAHCA